MQNSYLFITYKAYKQSMSSCAGVSNTGQQNVDLSFVFL